MSPQLFKRLLAGLVVALVLALLFMVMRPEEIDVDVADVRQGTLAVFVSEEAKTRVRDIYVVSAPVTGRLLRIDHDVGDRVIAGETVIARILPTDPTFLDIRAEAQQEAQVQSARASLDLAEAEVARTRAERDYAQAELDRTQQLYDGGHVSVAAVDRARMAFATTEAGLNRAMAAVAVARSDLTRAQAALIERGNPTNRPETHIALLHAPVTGQILRLLQESEAVVLAGQDLVEMGDAQFLEIVAELVSSDAVRVAQGAQVSIRGWGGETLRGRVRRVEPFAFTKTSALGVEEQRANVIIDFAEPQSRWQQLGHGYRVEVDIEIWREEDVLMAPSSALFRDGNRWAVFVMEEGRARLRHVDVGQFGARDVQILSGLSVGQQVIVHPGDGISDGGRIRPRGGPDPVRSESALEGAANPDGQNI